ncbi:hypothetical protein [Nitrosomonas sp. ANs5]|uniref:hypothetical protein n=1 Tax=Nitrosomonas sp. ANs5 TaxID=3423941 RepID=UPI003D33EDCE
MSLLGGFIDESLEGVEGLIDLGVDVSDDGIDANVGIGDTGLDASLGGSGGESDSPDHGDDEGAGGTGDSGVAGDGGSAGSAGGAGGIRGPSGTGNAYDNNKAFVFEVSGNEVIAFFELIDGVLKPAAMQPNEFFVLDGRDIVRNKGTHFGTEMTRFVEANDDGLFFRDSESWSIDHERSGPFPSFLEPLRFAGTDGDDFLSVREGTLSFGGAGADAFVIREAAHLQILDFNKNEGDKLVFDLAIGLQSKEQLSSYITDIAYEDNNFVVSFGSAASITLMGVNPDQIGWADVVVMS